MWYIAIIMATYTSGKFILGVKTMVVNCSLCCISCTLDSYMYSLEISLEGLTTPPKTIATNSVETIHYIGRWSRNCILQFTVLEGIELTNSKQGH